MELVPLHLEGLKKFKFLNVGVLRDSPHVGRVELNRPDKSNAFNTELWEEFPKASIIWVCPPAQ